ncbi:MAG: dihydropteroate synthase [Chloroflexi bacterium]|nr:dihydropteroate synthase [Chloroflexota bacterium]
MAQDFNVRVLAAHEYRALAAEIAHVESFPERVAATTPKGIFRVVRADQISYVAAIILKQELLALDADGVISPAVYLGDRAATTDLVIFATQRQYRALIGRIRAFPMEDLHAFADQLEAVLTAYDADDRGGLTLRDRAWRWGERTLIMGIINTTPDSFSGDGLDRGDAGDLVDRAVAQARHFAESGADLLDVGGESTRPGARLVEAAEERERVVPVIEALRRELDLPISVDTWKAEVAAAALDAGADLVNDVWGLRLPEGGWHTAMADLVRERNVPIILMHNRRAQAAVGTFGGHYRKVEYNDLLGDMLRELRESIAFALERGIRPEQIIVDPGIGFGKTPAQNIEVLCRLSEFKSLGYPLLLATSRKSFIGLALGNLPPDERVEGTAATVALGIQAGADMVRVHDVAPIARLARMTDAIVRPGAWERLTAQDPA